MLQVPLVGHAHIFGSSAEGGLETESMKKGQEEQEPGGKKYREDDEDLQIHMQVHQQRQGGVGKGALGRRCTVSSWSSPTAAFTEAVWVTSGMTGDDGALRAFAGALLQL